MFQVEHINNSWRERVWWMRKVETWSPTLEEGEVPAEEEGGSQ